MTDLSKHRLPSARLFVAKLAPNVTSDVLRKHFESFGFVVTEARVSVDWTTLESKGFGFVMVHHGYDPAEQVRRAIQLVHGTTLRGRQLVVKEATPPRGRE
jgi:RNA recognition motif-containing protein